MPAELHALCTRQQAQRGHLGSASALPHSLTTPSALLSKLFCSVLQLAEWFITPVQQASCPDFQLDVLAVVSERGQGRAERWERLRPTPKRSSKIKCKQVHRAL